MSRLMLFFLLGFLAYLLVKNLKRRAGVRRSREAAKPIESMVVCAHCSVHIPESEAVFDQGLYFCSEAHRKLGGR